MSQFSGMDLDSLIKLSEANGKQIEMEMAKFDKVVSETLKNAPDEHKGTIELFRANFNKAVKLAKEGKQEEAEKVINQMKNGR